MMLRLIRIIAAVALATLCIAADAQQPTTREIEIPGWFKSSFLDFRADVSEAAAADKRLLVYFGQDGCPYCQELMQVNFSQKDIVDLTRNHFDALALSIWGDREVTWIDGSMLTEKQLAEKLKVQFTPTLLFFDEKGNVVLRVNGYYPPHKFRAALDYVSSRKETQTSFADYLKTAAKEPARPTLASEPFFMQPPYDLARRKPGAKPLAVLFESRECAACDELHANGFKDPANLKLIERFDVVRLDRFGKAPVITPSGANTTAEEWGRSLGVAYTPTLVFFDANGKEVFRIDAYLKSFHLASSLEYVASGAYLEQPSFQRFIQERGGRMRSEGESVDVWK